MWTIGHLLFDLVCHDILHMAFCFGFDELLIGACTQGVRTLLWLNLRRQKLVPVRVPENVFWANYFDAMRIHVLLFFLHFPATEGAYFGTAYELLRRIAWTKEQLIVNRPDLIQTIETNTENGHSQPCQQVVHSLKQWSLWCYVCGRVYPICNKWIYDCVYHVLTEAICATEKARLVYLFSWGTVTWKTIWSGVELAFLMVIIY